MTDVLPPLVLGPWTKGLWLPEPVPADAWLAQGHRLFDGSLTWPVMTVDGAAVAHNVRAMAAFARERGLLLAPHGKTSMAPGLFRRQLDAGAWGMTLATGNQLLAAWAAGVRRVLVANQVLDPAVLRWVAGVSGEPGVEVLLQVDSAEGVAALSAAAGSAGSRAVPVLVELGHAGGRTGRRTVEDVLDLARAAAGAPGVRVVGVTAYEGGLLGVASVTGFLRALRRAAEGLVAEGIVPADALVTSAGGSAYFDVVADVLGGLPGRVLLRSGSTVTHDHGVYARRTPFTRVPGGLEPALRVWAQVTSCPEPGLVLLGAGKRDVPVDEGMPVPLRRHRAGAAAQDVRGWAVTRTNDQHAYLEPVAGGAAGADGSAATTLRPGDVVELGISHPCTAFDKWRVVPVLDADLRVTELLTTLF